MGLQVGGLIGLYGGLICGIIGWYVGRKIASKERGLDETHDYIWSKARSYSWFATIASIYILFSLYLFGLEMSIAMVLGILLLVQLGTWGGSGTILSVMMYSESETNSHFMSMTVGLILIVFSFIFSVMLAMMLENWVYILLMLPFGLIGSFLIVRKPSAK